MLKHVYFWKPESKNGYLSNWYRSPFIKNNIQYNNNEQYLMWSKQRLFDSLNYDLENKILNTSDPSVIKNLGRGVKNFDQRIWDENKYDMLKRGLIEKFSQNENLKKLLINTNDAYLAEASPYDCIWGIGLSEDDAVKNKKWRGENLLGKALMEVRDLIK